MGESERRKSCRRRSECVRPVARLRKRRGTFVTRSKRMRLMSVITAARHLKIRGTYANPNFSISDIFIPELPLEMKKTPEPIYTFRGGKIYRYMTRVEEGKYMLRVQKDIYKNRAERILKTYR